MFFNFEDSHLVLFIVVKICIDDEINLNQNWPTESETLSRAMETKAEYGNWNWRLSQLGNCGCDQARS